MRVGLAVLDAAVEHHHDVGVIEGGRRARLLLEAAPELWSFA